MNVNNTETLKSDVYELFYFKRAWAFGIPIAIVAVNNGDVDGGVTWADGLGDWEDGFNAGALRKAVDAGLVDMNDMYFMAIHVPH